MDISDLPLEIHYIIFNYLDKVSKINLVQVSLFYFDNFYQYVKDEEFIDEYKIYILAGMKTKIPTISIILENLDAKSIRFLYSRNDDFKNDIDKFHVLDNTNPNILLRNAMEDFDFGLIRFAIKLGANVSKSHVDKAFSDFLCVKMANALLYGYEYDEIYIWVKCDHKFSPIQVELLREHHNHIKIHFHKPITYGLMKKKKFSGTEYFKN